MKSTLLLTSRKLAIIFGLSQLKERSNKQIPFTKISCLRSRRKKKVRLSIILLKNMKNHIGSSMLSLQLGDQSLDFKIFNFQRYKNKMINKPYSKQPLNLYHLVRNWLTLIHAHLLILKGMNLILSH